MIRLRGAVSVSVLLAGAGFLACLAAGRAAAETTAIVNATAWTLTSDAPVRDATIVITDGRIVSVASAGAAPPGAHVMDAAGKPVTPGLMQAATQLGLVEVSAATETVDSSAKSGVPGPAFDVQYAVNANSAMVQLARADGLTRALTHPTGSGVVPFAGQGVLLHLFESGDIVERPGTGVFVTIGGRSAKASVGSRAAQWQMLRAALDTAKSNLAATATATNRPAETLALQPVLAGKTPLAIATERASDLRQAAKLARDYGIRIVIVGGAEAWMVAQDLAAAKVAVIVDPFANLPASFDAIGARLDNAALLRRAGVTVALHLSSVQTYNAGSSLREGAGLAVANGLPYVEGLRSIMSAPARIWGVADRQGTLEPGKDGDLVIWDGDPLEPSTLVTAVLIQGRPVSLVTHQTALRDRYLPMIKAIAAENSK